MAKRSTKILKKKAFIFAIILLGLLLSGVILYALGAFNTGYQVTSGQSKIITLSDSSRVQVTNNGNKDYFIPTKTPGEWDAFRNHHPSVVTLCEDVKDGAWSGWTYGKCVNCFQSGSRSCTNPSPQCGGKDCSSGDTTKTQHCGTKNGGWGDWRFGSCVSCSQSGYRMCNNPIPACGGKGCSGSDTTIQNCGAIDGYWSRWSDWTSCTSCTQSRSKYCIPPVCNGKPCPSAITSETRSCGAVDGHWSTWSCGSCSASSSCGSAECGSVTNKGVTKCSRTCHLPKCGGTNYCTGSGGKTDSCSKTINCGSCGYKETCQSNKCRSSDY